MAEYRRTVGLEVINPGMDRALAAQSRGIEAIADVVARREQDVIRKRVGEAKARGEREGIIAQQEGRAPEAAKHNPILSAVFGKPLTTEAYEEGVKASYLTAAQADARVKIKELGVQFESDPDGFMEAVKSYQSDISDAVPPDLKPSVDQTIGMSARLQSLDIERSVATKAKANSRGDLKVGLESNMDAIANSLRAGDEDSAVTLISEYKATLSAAVAGGFLEEHEATVALNELNESVAIETVKGFVFQAYGEAEPGNELAAAVAEIDRLEEAASDLLSPDEKLAARKEIMAELGLKESSRKAGIADDTAALTGEALDIQIAQLRGEPISDRVEKFATKWGESEVGKKTYAQLLRLTKGERDEAAMLGLVQKSLSGGFPLSQDDDSHRDAVELYFQRTVMPNLPQGPEAAEVIYGFVAKTGVVPSSLKSTIVNSLGRPETAAQGLLLLDGLQRANPAAINQIPKAQLRQAQLMQSLVQAGVPPEQAVGQSMDLLNVDANKVKARRESFAIHMEDVNVGDRLGSGEGMFTRVVDAPPGLVADYITIAETEYSRAGDLSTALAMADKNVKGKWAVVEREGKRVWRNDPPELHYGVPGVSAEDNSAWILNQAAKDTGHKPEQIALVPAARRVSNDGRPVYQVMVRSEGGLIDAEPGAYFIPQWGDSEELERLTKQGKDRDAREMQKAHEDRVRKMDVPMRIEAGLQ